MLFVKLINKFLLIAQVGRLRKMMWCDNDMKRHFTIQYFIALASLFKKVLSNPPYTLTIRYSQSRISMHILLWLYSFNVLIIIPLWIEKLKRNVKFNLFRGVVSLSSHTGHKCNVKAYKQQSTAMISVEP